MHAVRGWQHQWVRNDSTKQPCHFVVPMGGTSDPRSEAKWLLLGQVLLDRSAGILLQSLFGNKTIRDRYPAVRHHARLLTVC